jgi:hypothetical protein
MSNRNFLLQKKASQSTGTSVSTPAEADNQALQASISLNNTHRMTESDGQALTARLSECVPSFTIDHAVAPGPNGPATTTFVVSPRLDTRWPINYDTLAHQVLFLDVWHWLPQTTVTPQWTLVHVGYQALSGKVPPKQPQGAHVQMFPATGTFFTVIEASGLEQGILADLAARGVEHPALLPNPIFQPARHSVQFPSNPLTIPLPVPGASSAGGGGGHGGSSQDNQTSGKKQNCKKKRKDRRDKDDRKSADQELGVDLGSPPKGNPSQDGLRLQGGSNDEDFSEVSDTSSSRSSERRNRKDTSQSHPIRTLDDVRVYGKTKEKLYERLVVVQPILRVSSASMHTKTIRDMVFRKSAVYSLLTTKMHNPMGSTKVGGFENLERLPEVWDIPIFETEDSFASFYLMKGWERGNYLLMSLRFFLKKGEKGTAWGEDHSREGRAALLKAIERVEVCFTILYDSSYRGKLAPLQDLSHAMYSNHASPQTRHLTPPRPHVWTGWPASTTYAWDQANPLGPAKRLVAS